jgi:hypothetical protein
MHEPLKIWGVGKEKKGKKGVRSPTGLDFQEHRRIYKKKKLRSATGAVRGREGGMRA